MDCTVVVLPSVPELGVAVGRANVVVATGGDAALVLEEQQDQRTAGYILQTWNHQRG